MNGNVLERRFQGGRATNARNNDSQVHDSHTRYKIPSANSIFDETNIFLFHAKISPRNHHGITTDASFSGINLHRFAD